MDDILKQQIKEYIANNLKIEIDDKGEWIDVKITLEDDIISEDSFSVQR